MSSSTRWESECEREIFEIRDALEDHHLYPHAWPVSTKPDGSETGNPAPRKWNPEPANPEPVNEDE